MKNPALAVLYFIAAAAVATGVVSWAYAAVERQMFDPYKAQSAHEAVFGSESLPSISEFKWEADGKLAAKTNAATWIIASGAGFLVIPLSITAIGRTTKNALREYASDRYSRSDVAQPERSNPTE